MRPAPGRPDAGAWSRYSAGVFRGKTLAGYRRHHDVAGCRARRRSRCARPRAADAVPGAACHGPAPAVGAAGTYPGCDGAGARGLPAPDRAQLGQVRQSRALLRLRRFRNAQRGRGLCAPAHGAEAWRRPAPRGRTPRGPRGRRAPGRGDARPRRRADPARRRGSAPGAGGGAALLHRPVRTGDRRAAEALRAQHPPRLAEGAAVPAGVVAGSLSPAGMDPERWQELSPLLDALLEMDPATRARHLEQLRTEQPELGGELARLLSLEGTRDDFLSEPLIAPLPGPRIGGRVGPYRLERMLGEGGMGQVWLASRADGLYQRRVALKLLRPGLADTNLQL